MLTFSRLGDVGRLGNQLFQIAFITAFSEKHGIKYSLPYWKYEPYFSYNYNFHEPTEDLAYDLILKEPDLSYNESYFEQYLTEMKNKRVDIIAGYFQSYKYFNKAHILKIFSPKTNLKLKINCSKSIAISVRRGDFVKHPHYNNIEADLFRRLLENFKNHTVFVFSDDYKYCMQEFIGPQYEFATGFNDIEQLLFMSYFEKFILSNSTFSYWGPMLNKTPKIVLYPQYMFPDLERCKTYNQDYWPNDKIYKSYLNPINKSFPY